MVRTASHLTVAALAAIALVDAAHGSGNYYGLGTSRTATGVNADGTVVAGTTATEYFIWKLSDPGVTTPIGGVAVGTARISDDGDKISGTTTGFVAVPPIPPTVVRQMGVYDVSDQAWTGVGGIGWFSGTETSSGTAMSGDGTKLLGIAHSPNQTNLYGVTSTIPAAPVALPWLIPGRNTRVFYCDNDGSVVVGSQENLNSLRQAAVWNNGVGQRLWVEYPKKALPEATVCSADGNWVAGNGGTNTNTQAWRWSQSTGVQLLGEIIVGSVNGIVTGMSADGTVIVGHEVTGVPATGPGWIWAATGGMQDLTTYATDNGVTGIPAGVTLQRPLGVSADGRTFVGTASNGQGFVVRIDPPALKSCGGDKNGDGRVDSSDLLTVISSWGQVNVSDLVTVINAWGDCP